MPDTNAPNEAPPALLPDLETSLRAEDDTALRYAEWKESEGDSAEAIPHSTSVIPHSRCRGTILLIHGYGEHMGRYGRLARQWTAMGFRVGGCDHRGMGKSGGQRAYVRDYGQYVADAQRAEAHLREGLNPDTPRLVFGHSMGGLVALRYAAEASSGLAGLLLSGPLVAPQMEFPTWFLPALRIAAKVAPKFTMRVGFDPTILTHDRDEQAILRADPLMLDLATPAWFAATERAIHAVTAEADRLVMPTLWLIPGEDKLCSSRASRALFDALSHPERHTWREYPGLFHELHNERPADRARVLADIAHWLESAVPNPISL